MNDSNIDDLLNGLLEQVEQLLHRHEALRTEKENWEQKAKQLNEKLNELQNKNETLNEKLDQQRLEFSELAGSLENRLNRIKQEANQLLPESD